MTFFCRSEQYAADLTRKAHVPAGRQGQPLGNRISNLTKAIESAYRFFRSWEAPLASSKLGLLEIALAGNQRREERLSWLLTYLSYRFEDLPHASLLVSNDPVEALPELIRFCRSSPHRGTVSRDCMSVLSARVHEEKSVRMTSARSHATHELTIHRLAGTRPP